MTKNMFDKLGEHFLDNVQIVRKAITSYRDAKKKFSDRLLQELKKRKKYGFSCSWDTHIVQDLQKIDVKYKENKDIYWSIDISAENMAEKKITVVCYEKESGRWEEKTIKEIVISNKNIEEIVVEIIDYLQIK